MSNNSSMDAGSTVPPNPVTSFIEGHIWLPVLGVLFVVAGLALVLRYIVRQRKNPRYTYVTIDSTLDKHEKANLDQELQRMAFRDNALLNCQFYLRSSYKYILTEQLSEIGRRPQKSWFRIKHQSNNTEKLLTMEPRQPKMVISFDPGTKKTLNHLLQVIKHPYIAVPDEIDFVMEQEQVAVIHNVSQQGSLKDLIYKAKYKDTWSKKYANHGHGLPKTKIQLFGRQILEALQHLEKLGFPSMQHLHTGNILVHGEVCRLAGIENIFIASRPKHYHILRRVFRDRPQLSHILCFGHLLYEMATGTELEKAAPEPGDLTYIPDPETTKVIQNIFDSPEMYASSKQLLGIEFFANVILKEEAQHNVTLTPDLRHLLKQVRKGKPNQKKSQNKEQVKHSVEDEKKKEKERRKSSKKQKGRNKQVGGGSEMVTLNSKSGKPNQPHSPPEEETKNKALSPGGSTSATATPGGSSSITPALLASIRTGITLKKAVTNDRSAPRI